MEFCSVLSVVSQLSVGIVLPDRFPFDSFHAACPLIGSINLDSLTELFDDQE